MQPKLPFKIIDLSHTLNPSIPSWDGGCGFEHNKALDYSDCSTEVTFRVQNLVMHAGIGTHIDAPAHCIPAGVTIDGLKLESLITACVMIDVSSETDAFYRVPASKILDFEKQHGKIAEGSFVIIQTGWAKHWHQSEQYRNNLQYPSISKEASELLLLRNIAGLGIDTLSPDTPDSGYPVHKLILGAGKYIVENIANADQIPATGTYSFALPMPIEQGTEAPIRLIALIMDKP